MDEKRILESLKKEDRSAFRELFDAYYDALILFANHLLNNAEAAEDVVQDCFVDFWISRRFEHLDGGIGKYLFQSVKHAALNDLRGCRRREKRHASLQQEISEEEEATETYNEELEVLYAAIRQLPEERRKIFTLICLEGKKYKEVADMLQISINTVKTQMGRSFQFLRKMLGNHRFLILLFWRQIEAHANKTK